MKWGSFIAFLITTILVTFAIYLGAYVALENKNKAKEKKIEAVILLNGKIIECEVDYYTVLGSGEAKIVSIDGTTYYTNSYKIKGE